MRFTIAVGILAQALPVVGHEKRSLAETLEQDEFVAKKFSAPLGGGMKSRVTRNAKFIGTRTAKFVARDGSLKNLQVPQECDPNSDSLDLGVLSCGSTMYCAESSDSLLGGRCVEKFLPADSERRKMQYDFCDAQYCDCSGFDSTTGYGTYTCTYANECLEPYCPETCGDATLTASYNIDVAANSLVGSFTACYDFKTPLAQSGCFGYSFQYNIATNTTTYACEVSFEGTDCGCTVTYNASYDYCLGWDCSAAGGSASNTCEGGTFYDIFPVIDDTCVNGPTDGPVTFPPAASPSDPPPAPTMAPSGVGTFNFAVTTGLVGLSTFVASGLMN